MYLCMARHSKNVEPEDVDDSTDEAEGLRVKKPRQKRQKCSVRAAPISAQELSGKKVLRRHWGLLGQLPEMPLDILFEVCVAFSLVCELAESFRRYSVN